MKSVLNAIRIGKRKPVIHAKRSEVAEGIFHGLEGPIESEHLLISTLLPPAVKAFLEQCEKEVEKLCGEKFSHNKDSHHRWGSQKGSIVLANQRVALEVPRVRHKDGQEKRLDTYEQFQDPTLFDRAVFTEGVKKVSSRDYGKGVSKIANSFGFTKSSISRKWIKSTAQKLEALMTRSFKELDIRAVFLDGKSFHRHGVLIALGIASSGKKHVLGIYETSSENHQACLNLLQDLERRGLPHQGLLFVVDGGGGINKALDQKYDCHDPKKRRAIRIRCFAHKWRNIEKVLGDSAAKVSGLFWSLREANDIHHALRISSQLETELARLNLSALHTYQEAKDDLLVIHELLLSPALKKFFSTTNPIESLNSLVEEDLRRVKHWKDSNHFQRWLATFCLESENRMRRPKGHKGLPALWTRLETLTNIKNNALDVMQGVA